MDGRTGSKKRERQRKKKNEARPYRHAATFTVRQVDLSQIADRIVREETNPP